MGKATWDTRRTFSPNAWEILFLQEMNQMCPVAQVGRWEIWVCVCPLFTAHHRHSKCRQCALLFDQLLEVWGQGLALHPGEHFQHKSGNQTWKGRVESYLLRFVVVVV